MARKIWLALVVATRALAEPSIGAAGKFWIDVDYARFYGNDTLTYVEIYYSVPEEKLTYRESNGRFLGGVNLYVAVTKDGRPVNERDWTTPHVVQDSAALGRQQNIIGLTSFSLPRGDYDCEVRANDFYDSSRSETLRFPIRIVGFSQTGASLSDVELCSSIRQIARDDKNLFYKNTLEALPNVTSVYGAVIPVLFYYVEAYNLLSLPTGSYVTRTIVYDAGGREVIRHEKTKRRANNSGVEVGTVNVHKLKGGTYAFAFYLLDSSQTSSLISSKKFFVYRPGVETAGNTASDPSDVPGSEFGVMQEFDLDTDFAYAAYIATPSEVKQYKDFGSMKADGDRLRAKRNFLFNFWRQRAEGTDGRSSEFRQSYLRRVEESNTKFGGAYKKGWQTDRGRVYILYGLPDEIERFPSASDQVPHEIWRYNQIQGGVISVFLDRTGFGDWILVHSTHRNEIHDENWYLYLKK